KRHGSPAPLETLGSRRVYRATKSNLHIRLWAICEENVHNAFSAYAPIPRGEHEDLLGDAAIESFLTRFWPQRRWLVWERPMHIAAIPIEITGKLFNPSVNGLDPHGLM